MNNKCVCCGEIIPEGVQVCPNCIDKSEKELKGVSNEPRKAVRSDG